MAEQDVLFWYWWVLAVGFLALEIVVTGFFFLWLAVSAFIVGAVVLLIPVTPFNVQLLLFSLLAVLSVLGWRKYARTRAVEATDHPLLNKRGAQYIGRTFNLIAPIENGQGKIKVDDTFWKVHGEDSPMGAKVKVVAIKGTVFEVEVCR
ncbi:NfeD family protein [Methylomonas montana]|uniref:NfeD family protein n=1 Tax=Methylomonas montana TaxID=3058963 RepID=UPI002657EE14|nr:NfeD family protein [Methylomonas montana]WKJ90391.1 NfeD family protein [Methylomonas montana]